jgi:hypothetical protein
VVRGQIGDGVHGLGGPPTCAQAAALAADPRDLAGVRDSNPSTVTTWISRISSSWTKASVKVLRLLFNRG